MLNIEELIEKAVKASENSYSPYSKFKVGSALLTKDGQIYTGTNIENASYSLTNCAERTAIFKAISEAKLKFYAIAIYCNVDKVSDFCMPCGACRQVMAEFFDQDTKIIVAANKGKEYKIYTIDQILPNAFKL